MRHRAPGSSRLPAAAVLALVALVGFVNVPMPLGGDQALFAIYARDLDAGRVLYRDMWDSKQPGIFLLYWAVGRVTGFSEAGFHAFEALYMVAFSAVLLRTGRSFLDTRAARLALPLFAVGLYLLTAKTKQLTQVEPIVGLPLYLALWWSAARDGSPPSPRRAFAAGVAGGLVVWLKLYLVPVVGAIWILAWVRRLREDGRRSWTAFVLPLGAGFALPVAGLVAWLAWSGTLRVAGWTYFVYPGLMAEMTRASTERIASISLWFLQCFAVAIVFAACGLVAAVTRRRGEPLLAGALAWIMVGGLLVVLELSWWAYYLLILTVPLALYAAAGVDWALAGATRRRRVLVAAITVLALVPSMIEASEKLTPLLRHRLALASDDRSRFRGQIHAMWGQSYVQAEWAKTHIAKSATVHVFGDPLILYLARRSYAIAFNGWSPQVWPPEVWEMAASQLERARPDYIYLAGNFQEFASARWPPLADFLRQNYADADVHKAGRWLRLIRRGEPEP